jgi:two-component system response regulator YesN
MTAQNKSLKLMIVDDEPIMLEGLKVYLDWKSYSIDKIITSQDGKSALESAKREKPDIVITDIRMPEMSGLELISNINDILPDCVCIIISGHNDFEYAKKGLELGAFYYIVKPIEEAEFKMVISNAVDVVYKKREEKKIISQLQESAPSSKKRQMKEFLSHLILKKTKFTSEQLKEKFKELGVDFYYPYYSVCVTMMWTKAESSQLQVDDILSIIEKELHEEFTDSPHNNCCIYNLHIRDQLVTVIGFKDFKLMEKQAERIFNNISETITKCFNWFMITVLGTQVSNINQIYFTYTGAERLCKFKTFFNNTGFYQVNSSETKYTGKPFLLTSTEKIELIEMVKNNDTNGIFNMLSTMRKCTENSVYQDKYILFSVILEIMISTARILDQKKIKLEQFLNIEIFTYDFLESFINAEQLFKWLFEFFIHISNAYVNKENTELERSLTEEIKKYVNENYSSKITLQKIADHFHYNYNYLGRLFKKNEGVTFSAYLNNLRIKKAHELLIETDYNIEEIAYKTGYNDSQYFIKVFKSKMGTTPLKYRTQMVSYDD